MMTFLIAILGIDYQPQIIEDKPNAYEVIKYMNNDINDYPSDTYDFYLLFDSYKLDSKNFVNVLSYFDAYDYKITEVYPYINPLYQTILKDVYKISYKANYLNDGIANIYNIYLKELEDNRLGDEIDKTLVNGVRIRMIKINLNNGILSTFIQKYQGVKYSLTPYGLFRTFWCIMLIWYTMYYINMDKLYMNGDDI